MYLDDVIVYGQDFDEHFEWLAEVFRWFCQAGLKPKPSKCCLLSPRVPYLGHGISAEGVRTDPAKIEAVKQWPVPLRVTGLRSFLGLASYYRRFLQDLAEIAAPLHWLTAKTTEKLKWTAECNRAFRVLKEKLVSVPVLAFPCFGEKIALDCDAS